MHPEQTVRSSAPAQGLAFLYLPQPILPLVQSPPPVILAICSLLWLQLAQQLAPHQGLSVPEQPPWEGALGGLHDLRAQCLTSLDLCIPSLPDSSGASQYRRGD